MYSRNILSPGSLLLAHFIFASVVAHAEEATDEPWHRYENLHFQAYSDAPGEEVRLLLEDLENFRVAVAQFSGSRVPQDSAKTRVIIFRAQEDFANIVQSDWVEAYTAGLEGVPYIIMWAEESSPWAMATMRHEYIHVLQGYSGEQLAPWYFEGLAECLSGIAFRNQNTEFVIGGTTERPASRKSFVEWERLIADDFRFDELSSNEQVSSAYYQAGLLVCYLHVGDGFVHRDKVDEYLSRNAQGEASLDVFESVFGEPVEAMGPRVYKQRRRRLKPQVFRFLPGTQDHDFEVSAVPAETVQQLMQELVPPSPERHGTGRSVAAPRDVLAEHQRPDEPDRRRAVGQRLVVVAP